MSLFPQRLVDPTKSQELSWDKSLRIKSKSGCLKSWKREGCFFFNAVPKLFHVTVGANGISSLKVEVVIYFLGNSESYELQLAFN